MKKVFFLMLFLSLQIGLFAQSKDTITTSTGLKYVMTKPGNGKKPSDGQTLKVRYRGTLLDGTIFDQNMDQAPFEFILGAKEVIPGWEEGFRLMSKGEKGYLFIPARLAYGPKGVKSTDDPSKFLIPPDSDLIFEVELIKAK